MGWRVRQQDLKKRSPSTWIPYAKSTGRSYPVQPVVVFPGWYVEKMNRNESREVWVLNPRALPAFIENEPVSLRQDEVHLVDFHLSRYVRTKTEELL